MPDIVERLREAAKFGGHYAEAADEIERLRTAVAEAHKYLAEEIEGSLHSCCPHNSNGEIIRDEMDEPSRPMIEEMERVLAVLDAAGSSGSDSERHPPGPRCTCGFHADKDEIVDPDPHCPVHGSICDTGDDDA